MSSLVVAGDTSGSITLQAPAVAGSTVITLPATSGTMALAGGAITGTDLTTTGNTILGDASTDTLNVGNGGLVKNSSGIFLFNNATAFYDTIVNAKGNNGFFAEVVQASGGAYQANYTAGSGTCYYGYWQRAGSLVGSISSSGSTTAYNTSSDYRLKENVQPMVGALDKIALLKPSTYTWKLDGSEGEGFIAHELQEIFPQAVTGIKDAVNEDGSIEPQGIDTSFLVATLTAAIQEQQALIENLTTRLAALENK